MIYKRTCDAFYNARKDLYINKDSLIVRSHRWLSLDDLPNEHWKYIEEYEGRYQVSNYGRIKSVERIVENYHSQSLLKERIMKQTMDKCGYLYVRIGHDKKFKNKFVHRLVAQSFIPNYYNLPFINHKDENPLNNKVENLEWCDDTYNKNYGTALDRRSKKMKNHVGISSPVRLYNIWGIFIGSYPSAAECGRIINASPGLVMGCVNCDGRHYTCKGFIVVKDDPHADFEAKRLSEEFTSNFVVQIKSGIPIRVYRSINISAKYLGKNYIFVEKRIKLKIPLDDGSELTKLSDIHNIQFEKLKIKNNGIWEI